MKRLAAALLSCVAMAPQAATEIKPFVRGSLAQIAAARHDRPFIVSFWSITCTYCRDELSLLSELARKEAGIDVVLVATDTPDDIPAVAAVLDQYPLVRLETWVFADAFAERLRFDIDRDWHGELPRTYLYDAAHRKTTVSGKLDSRQVERWLRSKH